MKTKSLLFFLGITTLMGFGFCSCSDDDDPSWPEVDGAVPTLSLASEHISTEAGKTISIEGKVADNDGIASIQLLCPDLSLNKTIDIIAIYKEPLKSYDLSYNFKLDANEIGDQFTVKVIVTDVGGRSVTSELQVTLDADFSAPTFISAPDAAITVLIKAETKYKLSFSVQDNRSIDYINIEIPGIEGYAPRRIEVDGQKMFEFSEAVSLPNSEANYDVTISAFDKSGKSTVKTSTISVSEMPDFPKMYLADVATVAELNSDVFGVPMLITRTGEYTYKANYYCEKAGTEIFFIPQKSDFAPICFGMNPDNNTKLTDDPETALPIVLPEAGVYYEITFNTKTCEYEVSSYTIAEAIDPVPHEYESISLDTWENGGEKLQKFYFGYMTDGPKNVDAFTQDATNPHLYYLAEPLYLEAGTAMNFVIHNWHSDGWWNYCTWRVDNSADPEIFGYYGKFHNPAWTTPNWVGDNWAKPMVNVTGNYKLIFDAHLERCKLVRVN